MKHLKCNINFFNIYKLPKTQKQLMFTRYLIIKKCKKFKKDVINLKTGVMF